jgi:hypothetical protein
VIEVGQCIQKPGRRVVGDGLRVGRERRFQKNGIGICRLELVDVERGGKSSAKIRSPMPIER